MDEIAGQAESSGDVIMMTTDKVRALLTEKMKLEKARLQSYGTKYSLFDLANAVAPHVLAFVTLGRLLEVKRTLKWIKRGAPGGPATRYLRERKQALKKQRRAVKNLAQSKDDNRPWKSSPKGLRR